MTSLYTSENTYLMDSVFPYMGAHAAGDFNGDGLLDFFGAFTEFGTSETFEIVIYSQSPSTGYMTDVTADWIIGDVPRTTMGRTVEVRDFNGDGVVDIFVGDAGRDTPPDFPGAENVLLLSQDGKLFDASSTLPQLPDFTHGSASGDIDGDGDIDIFVGNFTSETQPSSVPYFLVNDGNGVFSQNTSFVPGSLLTDGSIQIGTAELADFDGDGHTDLIIGSHSNSSNRLYLGDGSGNFRDEYFKTLPVQLLGGVAGNAVWMHSFDLENDGDLDVAISYYGQPKDWLDPNSYSNRAIQVLENVGGGEFQDVTGRFPLAILNDGHTPAQWFVKVASKDLNGDGYEDLYVSNLNTAGQPAFAETPVVWITNEEGGYTVLTQEYFSNQFGNSGYPGPFEFVGSGNDIFSIDYRAEFLRNTIDFNEIVAPRLGKVFYSAPGNDILNGGSGFDTAFYSGDQSSYTLALSPTSMSITDRRAVGDGTDTLIDIEFLDFDTGADFDLTQFGGPSSLSPEALESFIELYIAYFNRAPDAIGLNFWGTAFANGTSLEEIAALFAPQDETLATYPEGTSNEDFAFSVYTNVLGRDPDVPGYEFWVGQLDAGNFSRDQFILEVLRGVEGGSPDRQYLDSKVDVGAYFSVIKGMSDVGSASAAMALFDGTQAGINNAVNAIDSFYQDALDPNDGEFIMQVVGILDDPFAIA